MNTRTHTIASLDQSKFVPVPAPDLMDLIETTAPGKDGLSLLYSLAGGLDFRIARLAAIITNVMAGHLRKGDENHPAIDKMNDAIAGLNEASNRVWAFDQAGISQHDMMSDLKDLVRFRNTVVDHISDVTDKPFPSRWNDTIEKAATPQAVDEWKLELSWTEYVEGCHGKTEMNEEEFKKFKSLELAGAKQNWAEYASHIIDTIETYADEACEFDKISAELQKQLLESISSPEKEAKFRTGAMKMARSPEDLHTRRMFISSFCTAARLALTHSRYADRGEVIGPKEQNAAYAKKRLCDSDMTHHNDDFVEA